MYDYKSIFNIYIKNNVMKEEVSAAKEYIEMLQNIIIIINLYILVTLIKLTYEKLYAMYVEWTKFSEIENYSLFIQLLHAVEMTD